MANDLWQTPKWLMKHFLFHNDPCPALWNPMMASGLEHDWDRGQYPAYVNPPYSRGECEKWVRKSIEQQKRGVDVVLLLRVDSSTEWYRLLVEAGAHFAYFNERLHFDESKGSPNFSSMLVFLEGKNDR